MNVLLYYTWRCVASHFSAANICIWSAHVMNFPGPVESETVLVMSFSVAVLWRGVRVHIIAVRHPP